MHRVDGEQLDDAPDQSRLLVQLADRAGLRVFAEVDAAAGQRPRTRCLGDVREPAQEQPVVGVDADVVRRDPLDAAGRSRLGSVTRP